MKEISKFETSQESVGFLFWQTHMLWSREIKKVLTPFKLSHTQFVILAVINYLTISKEEVSQVDISELSNIDVMTISTSLKALTKNGYVIKDRSLKDARAYVLKLSDSGKSILKESIKVVEAVDALFFNLPEDEFKQFSTSLEVLKGTSHA